MFEAWGRFVYRRRRPVLLVTLAALVFAAIWGTGVFGALKSAGGFDTPGSESYQAAQTAEREFGRSQADVVILYRSPGRTVDDPAYKAAVTSALNALPKDRIAATTTYWSTGSPRLVSADHRSTYAVVQLRGADPQDRTDAYERLKPSLASVGGGLTARLGGALPTETSINDRVSADIGRGEGLTTPMLLVLLL